MNNLWKGIKQNTSQAFDFYCYTEDPEGLLPEIKVIPLTLRDDVEKQWYKIDFHNMPEIKGKCLILDIDYLVVGNIDDILSWDLPLDHFGCNYRWWSAHTDKCAINGGFQLFYQGQTRHLYNLFYSDPKFWQSYYINIGHAVGPVNGEQNFIDNNVNMSRSWLPSEWFAKYFKPELGYIQALWNERIDPNEMFFFDGEFDSRIKMVHFSDSRNTMDEPWIATYSTHRKGGY